MKERLRKAASKGFINATDCADYLVKRGMPFREAYKIVGTLVAYCIDNNKTLEDLSIDEYKEISEVFENDIYSAIDLSVCVNGRRVYGGPAASQVTLQIEKLDKFISEV